MNRKEVVKANLIGALIVLAFGGWLLHTRIHSPMTVGYGWVPFISGVASVIILPFLFWNRRTLPLAYIINGFSVIIGTITMAHFSIAHFKGPFSVYALLFQTMLPDISMLWGKLFVGKAIFDLEYLKSDQDTVPGGRFFRYPNWGWWLVHMAGLSVVYALGNILWK